MDKIIRPIHRENVCFRHRRLDDVKISKRKASTDFQTKDSTNIVTWLLSPKPTENRYDPALLPAWGAIFSSD